MPDIFTHLLLGLSLGILWKQETKEDFLLIVIGSVIIDIERPLSLIFTHFFDWGFTRGFHSLFGAFCLSSLLAFCFDLDHRSFFAKFKLLFIGCLVHLFADMTFQKWPEVGIHFLYPLRIPFSFNLLWSDFLWFPVIGLSLFTASLLGRYFYENYYRKNHSSFKEILWLD